MNDDFRLTLDPANFIAIKLCRQQQNCFVALRHIRHKCFIGSEPKRLLSTGLYLKGKTSLGISLLFFLRVPVSVKCFPIRLSANGTDVKKLSVVTPLLVSY
jgi:hypothetical protein